MLKEYGNIFGHRNEPTRRWNALGAKPGPKIHIAGTAPVIFVAAVPGLAQDADRVGVVDHQHAPEVFLDLDQVGKRANVAFHREYSIGYDQRAVARAGSEFLAEGIEVVVPIPLQLNPGETAGIHKAPVGKRIENHAILR